jgi:hypothetical protein
MKIIPKELYIGLQVRKASREVVSADGSKNIALGFMTYKNSEGKIQHNDTLEKWRDQDLLRIAANNDPIEGFIIAGFVTRYSTSNKYFRIEDPRGYQLEISAENLCDILKCCTVENGVIKDKLVWGWNNNLFLYKYDTDDYWEGIDNFDITSNPSIPLKQIKIGNTIKLRNGIEGIYCGLYHYLDYNYRNDIFVLIEKKISTSIDFRKGYLIKSDKGYKLHSQLVVKKVLDTKEGFDDSEWREIIQESLQYRYLVYKARDELQDKGAYWNDHAVVDPIYNKWGLANNGYDLKNPSKYGDFIKFNNTIYISKKPLDIKIFNSFNSIQEMKESIKI